MVVGESAFAYVAREKELANEVKYQAEVNNTEIGGLLHVFMLSTKGLFRDIRFPSTNWEELSSRRMNSRGN